MLSIEEHGNGVKPFHTEQNQQLSFLDTSISIKLDNLLFTNSKTFSLDDAEKSLYDHFRNKDIISVKELEAQSTHNADLITVQFDTVYLFQLEKYNGGVISYWLGSENLNGHCFQPKKAIILNSDQELKIINEEFIPTSFTLDSTSGSLIYGYEYECGGRGVIRQFRISLR